MADINKVLLIGRLTRDAELSYTPSNFPLLKFSIAVNRRRKQGEQWVDEANFFDITVFGRQGEAIVNYMAKGRQIAVDGQLKQERWEASDGSKRSRVTIDASYVQLIGGRDDQAKAESHSGATWNAVPPSGGASEPPRDTQPAPAPTSFEDDIPF